MEDLLEFNCVYPPMYLQITCYSNSTAIGYSRFQSLAILICLYPCTYGSYNFEMFWGHIFDKLVWGTLPTLSNLIIRSDNIRADLQPKITRQQMIGGLDRLVMAEDLLESKYIYLHIYLQIVCFSNSAGICYSRFGIVSVICYFNIFISLNIKQLQLWNVLRTYIA